MFKTEVCRVPFCVYYKKKNQLVRLFSIASLIFLNVNRTRILSFFRLLVIHFSIIICVAIELKFCK